MTILSGLFARLFLFLNFFNSTILDEKIGQDCLEQLNSSGSASSSLKEGKLNKHSSPPRFGYLFGGKEGGQHAVASFAQIRFIDEFGRTYDACGGILISKQTVLSADTVLVTTKKM